MESRAQEIECVDEANADAGLRTMTGSQRIRAEVAGSIPRSGDAESETGHRLREQRTALVARFNRVAERLFELSLALRTKEALTDDDTRLLSYYRKKAVRTAMLDERKLEAQVEDAECFAGDLATRLAALSGSTEPWATGVKLVRENSLTATTKPVRRPRGALPISVSALPPASLLTDLKEGRLTLAEVLTPSLRVREITLSDMRGDPALEADIEWRRQVLKLHGQMNARDAMREILKREPTKVEVRRAQRVWARKAEGVTAEVDRRRERMTKPTVMVPLVQALVLKFYQGRRRASAVQIAELVNDELRTMEAMARANGIAIPFPTATHASVERFISRLPESVRKVRKSGWSEWAKQDRMVDSRDEAQYANHIWEIDHTSLDISVIRSAEYPDEVVTAYATACVDAYSGLPMALFISSQPPDAYTTSLVLSRAIRRHTIAGIEVGGLPDILRPDHGRDFMSNHVAGVAARLPITLDPAAPHNPDGKPHVERFFRTLNQALAKYPGHKGAEGRSRGAGMKKRDRLLTMRALIDVAQRYVEQYAQRHRDDFRCAPLERFAETVRWRDPAKPDELDLLLLKSDAQRTLTRSGVRFGDILYKGQVETDGGHAYQDLVGRKVVVRYHPDINESIIVYDLQSNDRIGQFVREDLWKAQVGARASNRAYIPSLKERTTEYQKQLEREDRVAAKAARAKETEALVKERQEADEAAGERQPTRAERKTTAQAATDVERRRKLLDDLIDD